MLAQGPQSCREAIWVLLRSSFHLCPLPLPDVVQSVFGGKGVISPFAFIVSAGRLLFSKRVMKITVGCFLSKNSFREFQT